MTVRVGCCIPGCRRTFRREAGDDADTEIICGWHWRMVDQVLRDRQKRARARLRKIIRLVRRKAILSRGEARIDRAWNRAMRQQSLSWDAVKEDATIKAAFDVENAPRRKPRFEAEAAL